MGCHHLLPEPFSVGALEFGKPELTVIDPSAVFTPQTVKNAKDCGRVRADRAGDRAHPRRRQRDHEHAPAGCAGVLEPIREVLESDESDVIPCRALDSLLRSARCGHPNTALRRTAVAFVTPVI